MGARRGWKRLTVEIEGKEPDDLILALREALNRVEEGYLAGGDSNDTGTYLFRIEEGHR